jgi:hypothetical protein
MGWSAIKEEEVLSLLCTHIVKFLSIFGPPENDHVMIETRRNVIVFYQ